MQPIGRVGKLIAVAGLCAAAAAPGAAAAPATTSRACSPIINPYPGTRYEDSDLRRIRALAVSCRTARRVVRGAHLKALGITPPVGGIRSFTWEGWRVTGNLRGDIDTYLAKRRGGKRVRWTF